MAKAEDVLLANLNAFVAFARKRVGDPHLAEHVVQDKHGCLDCNCDAADGVSAHRPAAAANN